MAQTRLNPDLRRMTQIEIYSTGIPHWKNDLSEPEIKVATGAQERTESILTETLNEKDEDAAIRGILVAVANWNWETPIVAIAQASVTLQGTEGPFRQFGIEVMRLLNETFKNNAFNSSEEKSSSN